MKKAWLVIAFNNSYKTLIRKNPQLHRVVDVVLPFININSG